MFTLIFDASVTRKRIKATVVLNGGKITLE